VEHGTKLIILSFTYNGSSDRIYERKLIK